MRVLHNKGLQLTKAARCAPFALCLWGQSLRAAFAAEARCWAGQAGMSDLRPVPSVTKRP